MRRFWHFTLNLKKKIDNMPLFANYIEACPCFDTRLPSNRVQLNTRFVENQVIPDQTFKKKKFAWNSTFRKSSSMQKKIYKCDRPIFKESYSGVFNPYSDVLKPYSGVFLQNFL